MPDTTTPTPLDLDSGFTDPADEATGQASFGDVAAQAKAAGPGDAGHKVAPALHDHLVDVRKIQTHPDNPNEGDIPAIAVSLDHYGQVRPLLVQASSGFIVAGNHTYKAARLLGWRYVAAVVHDMTDAEAKKYLVADNRIAERAKRNPTKMADLLAGALFDPDTAGGPDALLVMGYTNDEAEAEYGEQLSMVAPTDSGVEVPAEYASNEVAEGRRDRRAAGVTQRMREIILMVSKDEAVELGVWLDGLRPKLGTTEVTDTVLAVVKFAHQALCEADAPTQGTGMGRTAGAGDA